MPIRLPIYGYRWDILDRGIGNLVQALAVPNLCQLLPDMDTVLLKPAKSAFKTDDLELSFTNCTLICSR